jgi:hypothetical protein
MTLSHAWDIASWPDRVCSQVPYGRIATSVAISVATGGGQQLMNRSPTPERYGV